MKAKFNRGPRCVWPFQIMQPLQKVKRREAVQVCDIKPEATSGASDGPERLLPTMTAGSGSGSAGTPVPVVTPGTALGPRLLPLQKLPPVELASETNLLVAAKAVLDAVRYCIILCRAQASILFALTQLLSTFPSPSDIQCSQVLVQQTLTSTQHGHW